MNFTKLLAMNFADSLPNCYLFSESVWNFENLRWTSFDGSAGMFIEAFLFNIMASADEFLKYTIAGGKVLKGLVNRRNDERALFLG